MRGGESSPPAPCPLSQRDENQPRGTEDTEAHRGVKGVQPGGNVDWDGQHCRFCRFFILCCGRSVLNARIQAGLPELSLPIRGKGGNDHGKNGKVGGKSGNDHGKAGKVRGKGGKPTSNRS